MTVAESSPLDDDLPAPVEEEQPELGYYVVECTWVPLLREPSYDATEVGRLHCGELVIGDRVPSSSDTRSEWVKLQPASVIYQVSRGGCKESRAHEGEVSAGGGRGAEAQDVPGATRTAGEGGFAMRHHCMLGTLLRHVGSPSGGAEPSAADVPRDLTKKEIDDIIARTKQNEELEDEIELPLEARIWSKEQLENFVSHGTQPRWQIEARERDLGLSGTMDVEQVEEVLRTAVEWISRADALVVACGAGMAADAGLPTLQGSAGGLCAWPGLRKLGLEHEELCDQRWFQEDPRLAWAFWLHTSRAYREATPHSGYEIVRGWAERAAQGGFVCTSNFDSHWAASGWPEERLLELHGALHFLQCSGPCCGETWPMPDQLELTENPKTHRVEGCLPTCPRCGSVARPFVEMFGDDLGFSRSLLDEQWGRFQAWREGLRDTRFGQPLVVCLELGCSPGSSARCFMEETLASFGGTARLIRVNPRHLAVKRSLAGKAVAVPLRALEALARMERIDGVAERASFICLDGEANGAEVVARRDATTGHVLRRAFADMRRTAWFADPETGQLYVQARSILNEKDEKGLNLWDPVPANSQVVARDSDLPAVTLNIWGLSFGAVNARLQARSEAVGKLLQDLLDAFGAPEYQSRLEACADRAMLVNLVREVHFRVLPAHGIALNTEIGPGDAAKKVLCMQAFLQSGKINADVAAGLAWSVHLSGYSRISSLPAAKAKGISGGTMAAAQAIVAVDASKKAAVESKWTSTYRPPKVLWVAGTWNKWEPKEMKWDGSRFTEDITVSKGGWESFQLLVMGKWESALYPSIRDGNPYVDYKLLGPDSKGHGRNWTMGRHPRDTLRMGEKVQLLVDVDAKGAARKVSWKCLGESAGRFMPQFTGMQLLTMEAQILGRWQYGTKPNIYEVSKTKEGFRFEGPHAGGRVSGALHANGGWLQAELCNKDGLLVGTIRLSYVKDGDTMISNFKNASKADWGKDIAAQRTPEQPK